MIRLKKNFKPANPLTSQGLICLGESSAFKHGIYDQPYYATIDYESKRVGTYSLPSDAGTGKTSVAKRVCGQISEIDPDRPVVAIDMQGTDWRQVKNRASFGFIADKIGEERWGYGRKLLSLSPKHLVEDNYTKGDEIFTLSWRDLSKKDWKYFLESDGGAKAWTYPFIKFIDKNKSRITSLDSFLDHINKAIHKETTTLIPKNITVQELKKWYQAIDMLIDSGAFTETGFDIIDRVKKKGSFTVFNFHSDDGDITMLYVSILLRKLYRFFMSETNRLRDLGKRPNTPVILIEEMNFLSPAKSGVSETPGEHWVRILVTKAEKAGFLNILLMQDLHDISSKTRRPLLGGIILTSSMTNKDRSAVAERQSDEVMIVLDNLDATRHPRLGVKEWAKIENKHITPFYPYAPQVEFQNRYANLPKGESV